jgi:hypothetical protein
MFTGVEPDFAHFLAHGPDCLHQHVHQETQFAFDGVGRHVRRGGETHTEPICPLCYYFVPQIGHCTTDRL